MKEKKSGQLRIAMLGHKRIPSREGGIEIVVEELSTRMVELGHAVTCYNRKGHHVSGVEFDGEERSEYKGVRLKTVPRIAHQMYFNEGVHEGKWNELPELASNRLFHFIWGKLYDRHIIQQFQLRFNENMSYGEDILFNTYYYTHIKHFVALNTAVYAYSCHLTTGLKIPLYSSDASDKSRGQYGEKYRFKGGIRGMDLLFGF